MITQELSRIQQRFGYLPRASLEALADRLALPLYRIQEVVSFFPHFRVQPPAEWEIHVCRDMACHQRGALELTQSLTDAVSQAGASERVRVCGVSCLGRCDRAPAVRVTRHASEGNASTPSDSPPGPAASSGAPTADVASPGVEDRSHEAHQIKTWLGRSTDELVEWIRTIARGAANWRDLPDDRDAAHPWLDSTAWRIEVRDAEGQPQKYAAVRQFFERGANDEQRDRLVRALETAGLLGMGGAGGRAYKKWSEVRQAAGARKFVVCNADESEPGTFKDRELLLRAPHLVLEGVILGGLVVGAERGYIYVRHEYEEQIAALEAEIAAATAAGYCGDNLLGSGRSFPVEVFVSPGGYICGEQTALIEAMEDKRAEPRNRPPELQTNGLWDMPTLLNNVETLAWVPSIALRDDGQWYAAQGVRPEFRGARFFSISGDVARPGVYEVPVGIPLGELIDRYAGGMRDARPLVAVALSGPSGGFLPAQLSAEQFPAVAAELGQRSGEASAPNSFAVRDLPLDIVLFRKLNLMLGAGIVVYAEGTDLTAEALAALRFFQAETCGKCVPCRLGTTKLVEWTERLRAGGTSDDELASWMAREGPVTELAVAMRQTAICGLGTVAANPLISLLAYFDAAQRRPSATPSSPPSAS